MQPAHALKRYLETLRTIQEKAQATEELSYHHALLQLLRDLDPTAEFIHEPKRTVAGRPDFILLKNGAPVGYIEAEAFGTDLDRLTGHAKAQVDAFKQNLDNFLLTNFLEFRLYRGGECVIEAKLPVASASPPMNVGADPRVCPEKGHAQGRAPTVASASSLQLLTAFLSAQPLPIRTPNELAIHLARRTRQLKRVLLSTLEAQLKQPPDAPLELRNLYRAFQETLLPDLTPAEFADLYAQTIAYGLFAARCSVSVPADEKARSVGVPADEAPRSVGVLADEDPRSVGVPADEDSRSVSVPADEKARSVGVPADEPSARRERYGSLGELATPQPSPEQILAYVYAILHAPAYRTRYAEFLRRDFPRIPLPPNRAVFEQLAALGQSLMALHLLEHPDLQIPLCKFPVAGDNKVERVRYDGERVWINAQQYFAPVPEVVWAYRVGGYVVCEKWLADRKGRVLSFDEVLTYQRVVTALARTLELQAQVDAACKEAWGW